MVITTGSECESESYAQHLDDLVSKIVYLVLILPSINPHNNRIRYDMQPIIKLRAIPNLNHHVCRSRHNAEHAG